MKVVIIGAGVAGLGIGWKLAKAGASVTVLERAQAGSGATGASAGMIAATAELGDASTPDALFAKHSNDLWPAFVKEVEAQSGLSVGFKRNGSLMVMMKAGDADNHHAPGSDVSKISAEEARAMEPLIAEGVAGALWAPKEAMVDTHALARGLTAAFAKAGGTLQLNETAVRIETHGGHVTGVRTPFHFYEADAYILAAGAWTSRIEGLPREAVPPVVPIKGEILVLAPPKAGALPTRTVWGNAIYVVPRGDRLLVGATAEQVGFDTAKTQQAHDWLRHRSSGLMPALRDWEVAEHWVGLRPASPDGLPILGPSIIDRLYVASGQYRNGILFAPGVADALCRLVLEQLVCPPAFDPRRFNGSQDCKPGSIVETAHRAPEGHPEYQPWLIGF